jgi:hypothetical protein
LRKTLVGITCPKDVSNPYRRHEEATSATGFDDQIDIRHKGEIFAIALAFDRFARDGCKCCKSTCEADIINSAFENAFLLNEPNLSYILLSELS